MVSLYFVTYGNIYTDDGFDSYYVHHIYMIEQDSIKNVNAVIAPLFLYFGAHKFSIQQIVVRSMVVVLHLSVKTAGTDTSRLMTNRSVSLHVITCRNVCADDGPE